MQMSWLIQLETNHSYGFSVDREGTLLIQMKDNAPIILNDQLWERLLELTDGAAALCYQCGSCTATCPWGAVRNEPLSVRTFIRQTQIGFRDGDDNLWLCTTCGQCQVHCPRGVNIPRVFLALRSIAWEQRHAQKGLPSVLWSEFWNNNPWSQPPSQRSSWAKNLEIPTFNPEQHEILLYIGCTSSFDRRAQKNAKALINVLRIAGVPFGFLGDDEPCCGEAVLSVGHLPYFQEIAQQTFQVFRNRGVSKLVTISPHCYDVFKNHYPSIVGLDAILPLHYTQYLNQLLREGRLKFAHLPLTIDTGSRDTLRVTFQDPCYLGRHNGEYEAPRSLLAAIPGIELVEMRDSGADGLCCGGGGGRMWLETPSGERFSDLRARQAAETGASLLATACPFCLVCLEDSLKAARIKTMQIMDIAEIAALAIGN